MGTVLTVDFAAALNFVRMVSVLHRAIHAAPHCIVTKALGPAPALVIAPVKVMRIVMMGIFVLVLKYVRMDSV